MAKVRFGTGIAEIRGSVGGSVYSRTHAGAIVRNRVVPVNPNTQAQDDIRTLFALVAANYTNLTPTQRNAWQDFADLVNVSNVFGESYTPTGRQIFQQCNMNLAMVGSFPIADAGSGPGIGFAPAFLTAPAMDYYVKPAPPTFANGDKSVDLLLTTGAVTTFESVSNALAPNATDDIQAFVVEATELMRPTIVNRAPRFRLLGSVGSTTNQPLDILAEWNNRFGAASYQAGMVAQVKISIVNKGGLRSDPVLLSATAV